MGLVQFFSPYVWSTYNYSPKYFFNLMMSEEFRSGILQKCTNMRVAMEGDVIKGDQNITNYPECTPFSQEKIDSDLLLLLANGINTKLHVNLWLLQTHNSTIYGNNNFSKLFPIGRRRWDWFNFFLHMYDPLTYPKSDALNHSLFNVRRILQHLQRNFELYWD